MEVLIYLANLLYLTSYLVRDMLRLRLLSVSAAVCLVGYFSSQPEPLITVILWNLVFVVLNLVHVTVLVIRRLSGDPEDTRPEVRDENKSGLLRKHLGNILGHSDIG